MQETWGGKLLSCLPPFSEEDRDLAYSVNFKGTRWLIETLPPCTPLVFASSVPTYGVPKMDAVDVHPLRSP